MKAGVVHAKNDIRYEEIEKPQPKKGQVLIKVKYTGICGSDVPRVNGDACHFFPNVLGHEFSGTIVEAGSKVEVSSNPTIVDIANVAKALDKKKAPRDNNRNLVLAVDTLYKYNTLDNFAKVCYKGDSQALKDAEIGKVYTMNSFMSQNTPENIRFCHPG